MGLLGAMVFFEAPAALLGLNCFFESTANRLFCLIGVGIQAIVSGQCFLMAIDDIVRSELHINVTNMLLLAAYKCCSVFLFAGVIYFHVCKHQSYRRIICTLSRQAKSIGCFGQLRLRLKKYSMTSGALVFGFVFLMFLVQLKQIAIGPKIHAIHSAITALACFYFETKFAILVKAAAFIFSKINSAIQEEDPRFFQALRKSHDALYGLVEECSATFQPILIFSTILQFQVALYSTYVTCINVWELEAIYMKIKIAIMCVAFLWLLAIIANYVHLTSACTTMLEQAQCTANILLRIEMQAKDECTIEEARLFRFQILHYRTLNFTVFGLFYLNNTFISTLIGALVAYLATLVQFHLLALQMQ